MIENSSPDQETTTLPDPVGDVVNDSSEAVVEKSLVTLPEFLLLFVFVAEWVTLLFTSSYGPLGWAEAISIGCCLGLPSMLAAWSSIRSGSWRHSLTFFLCLVNGFILTLTANPVFDWLLVMLPLAIALPVFLTLLVIKRVFGYFAPLESSDERFVEGLRFNLSHLFIVTTLLALLLAIGKVLWPALSKHGVHPSELVALFSFVVLFSFNTLMFVWALLGKQTILRTLIAIPIGVVTLIACKAVCIGDDSIGSDLFFWYMLTGLPLVSSFVLIAVFRYEGWRFWKVTT